MLTDCDRAFNSASGRALDREVDNALEERTREEVKSAEVMLKLKRIVESGVYLMARAL